MPGGPGASDADAGRFRCRLRRSYRRPAPCPSPQRDGACGDVPLGGPESGGRPLRGRSAVGADRRWSGEEVATVRSGTSADLRCVTRRRTGADRVAGAGSARRSGGGGVPATGAAPGPDDGGRPGGRCRSAVRPVTDSRAGPCPHPARRGGVRVHALRSGDGRVRCGPATAGPGQVSSCSDASLPGSPSWWGGARPGPGGVPKWPSSVRSSGAAHRAPLPGGPPPAPAGRRDGAPSRTITAYAVTAPLTRAVSHGRIGTAEGGPVPMGMDGAMTTAASLGPVRAIRPVRPAPTVPVRAVRRSRPVPSARSVRPVRSAATPGAE